MAVSDLPRARPTAAPARRTERCRWCGSDLADGEALGGRVRCAHCGAATTSPWPTDAELAVAYARYRPEDGRFSGAGDAVLRRTRGLLARRVDRLAPPGRVLDVGAGDGTLLDALARRGRDALGLERDVRRADVLDADVTEVDGEFAAVVLWHALEHLPEPGAAFDHATELLAPNGLLVVAVPNAGSLQARLFGDRWLHLDLPRHLVHLPARAVVQRARARGLRVTRRSSWRGGQVVFGWLHGLVGRTPGHPDLYDAIRREEARSVPMTPARRAVTLAIGAALLPVAVVGSAVEVASGQGGTVLVEARRA